MAPDSQCQSHLHVETASPGRRWTRAMALGHAWDRSVQSPTVTQRATRKAGSLGCDRGQGGT